MAQIANQREVSEALKRLKSLRGAISTQQLKTIKGQIIAGDICGAEKGLRRLLPAFHLRTRRLDHEVYR